MECLKKWLNDDIMHILNKYVSDLNTEIVKSLALVNQSGHNIRFVFAPTEAVQLAAVRKAGHAIQHIESPSEAVQLAAVQKARRAIRHIDSPAESVQRCHPPRAPPRPRVPHQSPRPSWLVFCCCT